MGTLISFSFVFYFRLILRQGVSVIGTKFTSHRVSRSPIIKPVTSYLIKIIMSFKVTF